MITLNELNPKNYELTEEQKANLAMLLEAMNAVRTAYGKPMIVNSGVRSQEDQDKLIKQGATKAKKSNHLTGLAVDIRDTDGKLWEWCNANIPLLENLGLYLEDRLATPTWVHFQLVAPKSGKRIFKP